MNDLLIEIDKGRYLMISSVGNMEVTFLSPTRDWDNRIRVHSDMKALKLANELLKSQIPISEERTSEGLRVDGHIYKKLIDLQEPLNTKTIRDSIAKITNFAHRKYFGTQI